MSTYLKTFGRWGGLLTLILLAITLLRQLIALVSFLLVAIKAAIVIAFAGLMLLILLAVFRDRAKRRRHDVEEI